MKYLLILTSLMSLIQYSYAKDQSISTLEQLASQFVSEKLADKFEGRIEVKANPIDSRLRLPHCPDEDLEAFLPDYIQHIAQTNVVGIRCLSGSKWSLYVPVTTAIYTKVVVSTVPIAHGHLFSKENLKEIDYDLTKLRRGFFQNIEQLIGKTAKRNLAANRPLLHNDVKIPNLIKRGDKITAFVKLGVLEITAKAIAMDNGSLGETITIKNSNSDKLLQGIVIDKKHVKISI